MSDESKNAANPSKRRPLNAADRQRVFGLILIDAKPDGSVKITNDWSAKNLTSIIVPQLIGVQGAPKGGRVFWHKQGTKQLLGFFQAIEDAGLRHLILSWAGTWVPRYVRGSTTTLSSHAHGTAIDINAAWNGLGQEPAAAGTKGSVRELVPFAEEHGFYWGGNFSRKDGMHFELTGIDP